MSWCKGYPGGQEKRCHGVEVSQVGERGKRCHGLEVSQVGQRRDVMV